jgi:hypothetical protein
MKPQRNAITDALGVRNRGADGEHVGDKPLRNRRLGDRLDRLDRDCIGCQRTNSSLSFA